MAAALLLLAGLPHVAPGSGAPAMAPVRIDLRLLAWLAGCWRDERGGRTYEEQWMAPGGGLMLGMSRTLRGDTLVEYELLRLERRSDGSADYVAMPSGQASAAFRIVEITDSLAVFENPEHDFPQRILYRRLADGSLVARIEGADRGRVRGVDFPMRRAECP